MEETGIRPHLIVIGPGKAATTWFQHVLYCDPQFWYPREIGEVRFFNHHYKKGVESYLELYEEAPCKSVTADVTPEYYLHPEAPRRVKETEEKINRPLRFMIICREPVSRLISDYQMHVRRGFEGSLSEAITNSPHLVESGLYWKNLNRWFKFFSEDQFLVSLFDDIKGDKRRFFGKVEQFLGLEKKIENPYGEGRVNPGGAYRSWLLERMLQFGGQLMRKFGAEEIVYRPKATSIIQEIYSWNREESELKERIDLSEEELRKYFREDVNRLADKIDNPSLPKKWGY
ncbi:hypothetical protein GGP72_001726 [Salinibacter ruber]|uniref:Sulfotransferase domain-containing protein n=1 Tax=Salinibacter ruber TaxID=146919 RepID=A0A9X2PVZ3_9BACT|nr:sulfotransferase domain-containing protein [Salinibacter ruber]MCS3677797.1 hypothetical protein [Salinibacter ruber]MCS3681085.1 hypothetical protein [Salinibacter ruber]